MKIELIILTLLAAFFMCMLTKSAMAEECKSCDTKTSVVKVEGGSITGFKKDGLKCFLGIPYAAPPTGKLRWKAPADVIPWKGVKECTKYGAICPQPTTNPIKSWTDEMSEDCLFLNVWSPAKSRDEKLPVMVWVHGGGFYRGAASETIYDCANIAQKGVVVVSINYRLGPLGFLAHPQLSKESKHNTSGNYGIQDQIKAMKWVKNNIAAFGGDPGNVTVFGESAGAVTISLMMISPEAQGLFHGVIAESGNPLVGMEYGYPLFKFNLKGAEEMGVEYCESLNCPNTPRGIEKLRNMDVMKLVNSCDYSYGINSKGYMFAPITDNLVIPGDFHKILNSDSYKRVPLLIGTNKDEGNIFRADVTAEKYRSFINLVMGKLSNQALALFPAKDDKTAEKSYYKFITDFAIVQPAWYVARTLTKKGGKVYLYNFTRVPDTQPAKLMGAYHSIELCYVFGSLDKKEGYNKDDFELSDKIMDYWVNFAKHKDPNGKNLPNWEPYEIKTDKYLKLDTKTEMTENKEAELFHKIQKVQEEKNYQ